MPELRNMTFVMACNSVFGRKPGQSLQDFNAELKALTPKDRDDLGKMFLDVGINVVEKQTTA